MKLPINVLFNKLQFCKNQIIKHFISFKAYELKIEEKNQLFQDYLSIVCIAKNEGLYIKEWVDFHFLIGVDKIYIYDNDSDDDMKNILKPYIDSQKVIYTYFPGKAKQLDAYNDALSKYKYKTKYMAFIDCDEFLMPEINSNIKDVINKIIAKNKRAGGIAVNWRMYGSSNLIERPVGGVIKNFVYRGKDNCKGNECIKTIANPRFVKEYKHVHYPTYYLGFNNIDENGKIVLFYENIIGDTKLIRINHYFTKSKEEWIRRRSLGKADCKADEKRTLDEFYQHDNNDIYDDIALKFMDMRKVN